MVSPTLMLLCFGKHRRPQVPTLRVQIPFPVVEMVGFEPTMEAELTDGVIRFALSLRHISMYRRLSRCVKTRLIFTVFTRGFNPLQTLPHGGSQIPHIFCRRSQPPPQATRCLDTASWSTSPSTIILSSPAAAVKNLSLIILFNQSIHQSLTFKSGL